MTRFIISARSPENEKVAKVMEELINNDVELQAEVKREAEKLARERIDFILYGTWPGDAK